jgi:hypothetical protein
MGEVWPAVPDVGDDVDDRAAVALHPSRVDFAHEHKAAGEIGLHYGLEALGRDRLECGPILAAGVVDQPVDAAVLSENGFDRGYNPLLVPYVANMLGGAPAVAFDLTRDVLEFFLVASNDRHGRPQ